jgi:hypothetical protein
MTQYEREALRNSSVINAIHSAARTAFARALSRRAALRQIGIAGLSLLAAPALADDLMTSRKKAA